MLEVIYAKYLKDYIVYFEFSNGKKGYVDLKNHLWGDIFEPIKHKDYFKNFQISEISNTIEWENGADFAPEFLLENCFEENL